MPDLLYKRDKTKRDVEILLQQNKNLVYYMLTQTGQLGNQDAESASWEALWDAIKTFSVYSDTAFSTYACTVIRNAINGVLRKQHTIKSLAGMLETLDENTEYTIDDLTGDTATQLIYDIFNEYTVAKSGLCKSILLVWYSSNFTTPVSNIAVICGTTASYVSRVQDTFRAYLSRKLKESN